MPATNSKFKIQNFKFIRGFTLIELLVVITLISIMSGIVTVGVTGQQKKARDAQRKSDLNTVKKALQSAKNDCKAASYYPSTGWSLQGSTKYNNLGTYLTTLKYLQSMPLDPKNTGAHIYSYDRPSTANALAVCPDISSGTNQDGNNDFVLRAKLEITTDPDLKTSFAKCSNKQVTITTPPSADTNPADGIDDLFYYYVCND